MKRILKWVGVLAVLVVLVLLGGAAYIHFSGIPSYPVQVPSFTVTPDSAMVAEGRRLATMVCHNCHMSANGTLEGKHMADMPAQFGKVWAPNITKGPKARLAGYSDAELAYFLRTGIKRDGTFAPPWMPKFPHLADYDIQSIVAYLRSDASELAASDMVQPAPEPSFLAKFLCRAGAFVPLPYPEKPITLPDTADQVALGKYVATAKVDCFGCHSPSFETMNMMEPEKTPGYFSGGNAMPNLEGEIVYTRNLTPDPETGIGNWTEEQFVKAVKYGQRDGKPALRYPMPPFTTMTDKEAAAVFAYLRTIPAIRHDVDAIAAGGK